MTDARKRAGTGMLLCIVQPSQLYYSISDFKSISFIRLCKVVFFHSLLHHLSMVSSHSAEKNRHYGKFATTSRLISCMVTEGLVTAHFVPYTRSSDAIVGLCLILRQNKELLVAVPLRGLPELHTEQTTELNGIQCPKVELVDPWDMLPYIYAPKTQERQGNAPSPWLMDAADVLATVTEIFKDVDVHVDTLVDDYDAVELWNQFAQDYGVDNKELIQVLSEELASSMNHQSKLRKTMDYKRGCS